jgi:hypothetical protein
VSARSHIQIGDGCKPCVFIFKATITASAVKYISDLPHSGLPFKVRRTIFELL